MIASRTLDDCKRLHLPLAQRTRNAISRSRAAWSSPVTRTARSPRHFEPSGTTLLANMPDTSAGRSKRPEDTWARGRIEAVPEGRSHWHERKRAGDIGCAGRWREREGAGRAGTRRDEAARAYDPREHPEHRDRSPGNGRRGEKRRTRIACAARLRSISPGCAGATDEGRRANQLQAVPTPNGAGRKHEEGSTRARTRREGTRRRERSGPCDNDAPHGSSAGRRRERANTRNTAPGALQPAIVARNDARETRVLRDLDPTRRSVSRRTVP